MNTKRTITLLISLFICCIVGLFAYGTVISNDSGGPVPYPINIGSLKTIYNSRIDPVTVLEDIKSGKEPVIVKAESGISDDQHYIMQVGWSQSDFLQVAQAYHKVVWKDDPNDWHLYRALFYTDCANHSGMFEGAELYFYQEIDQDGEKMYSVRVISIEPEYGNIEWGGDTIYPRPKEGWDSIDLDAKETISAEKALELAEQQGGSEPRKKVEDVCNISVSIWPWGYERADWRVDYGNNPDIANLLFWIPIENK